MSKENIEKKETPEEYFQRVYEGLKKPFPDEALSVDSSRGFDLTSLKAQYVVERLNDVCGVDGWRHSGEYVEVDGGIIFKGQLIISQGQTGMVREAVGFSSGKKNVGDAYKGAKTDSLSKCASMFGLGNEIFKGKVAPPNKKKSVKSSVVSNDDF